MQALLAFKRLGVAPDGSRIVFEVNQPLPELLALQPSVVTDIDPGIYSVRSDATDLRRLGPPSREASARLIGFPAVPATWRLTFFDLNGFAFSPDGRRVVFRDLGEGALGEI